LSSSRVPILGTIEIAVGTCGSLAAAPMLAFLLLRGAAVTVPVPVEASVFGLPAQLAVAGGLVWSVSLVVAGLMLTRRSRGGFALSLALIGACAAWLLFGMWRLALDPDVLRYLPTIGTGLGARLVRSFSLVLGAGALALLAWGIRVLLLDWPTGGLVERGRRMNGA